LWRKSPKSSPLRRSGFAGFAKASLALDWFAVEVFGTVVFRSFLFPLFLVISSPSVDFVRPVSAASYYGNAQNRLQSIAVNMCRSSALNKCAAASVVAF
jgi:hypothetical protein